MTPRRTASFRADSGDGEAEVEDSIARVIASWGASRPELDVEPIAITARLARLQAVVAPKLEAVFARFGVRGADFAVLATLARLSGEGVPQRRLALELGLSAGTMSVRIDRLVQRGLVLRQSDPDDGRGAIVSLTGDGREVFEACAPEHLANARNLLAGLSEHDRDELGRLLGKLLYTLEDPDTNDTLARELGLVVEGAPVALEQRRAVGLPPLSGLLVRHVVPTGPAASSGVRPGDLLTTANRRHLRTRHDLQLVLDQSRARRRAVALEVTRGAEPMRLRLATAAIPAAERSRCG
jgi:DNA-binding MarR family transcriptional regulator